MLKLSKSQFKPKALEVMRHVEQTGETVIITDHGKPTLEIKQYQSRDTDPFDRLKGSVVDFQQPIEPIDGDLWEVAS